MWIQLAGRQLPDLGLAGWPAGRLGPVVRVLSSCWRATEGGTGRCPSQGLQKAPASKAGQGGPLCASCTASGDGSGPRQGLAWSLFAPCIAACAGCWVQEAAPLVLETFKARGRPLAFAPDRSGSLG